MKILSGVSPVPVAWRHVNLIGKFEFSPAESQVDIDALAARYDDPLCWKNAQQEAVEDALPTSEPKLLPFGRFGQKIACEKLEEEYGKFDRPDLRLNKDFY